MKQIFTVIFFTLSLFASFGSYSASLAGPGECNFDVDCGVGQQCVGPFGQRSCVKK